MNTKFSLLIIFCLVLTGCWRIEEEVPLKEKELPKELYRKVLVTVPPYVKWINEIAGETLEVVPLVAAGTSLHHFEPTPKQVLEVSETDVWFTVGEPFEENLYYKIAENRPDLLVVKLSSDQEDVHVWLSPPRVKAQVGRIAEALSLLYPENADLYARNAAGLQDKLERLDREIGWLLRNHKEKTVLVSHPALGYFCEDYFLKQLAIEHHGHEPSPSKLTETLSQAQALGIDTVFVIPQHNLKGARLVAAEIGAELVIFDPFHEDYASSLKSLARKIASD